MSLASIRILLFVLTGFVGLLQASDSDDDLYITQILSTRGFVARPDRFYNCWRSFVTCELENGLHCVAVNYFPYECQAQDEVDYQLSKLKGRVKVWENYSGIYKWRAQERLRYKPYEEYTAYDWRTDHNASFELYLYDGGGTMEVNISLRTGLNLDRFPELLSIKEKITVDEGWIWNDYKYNYLLECSNGTVWETSSSEWKEWWPINSHILIIGSSSTPCLINVDLHMNKKEVGYIRSNETLNYFFNVKKVE